MTDDQKVLMRRAAQSVVNDHECGRSVDPQRLEWAEHVLANVRMHPAEPVRDDELPPALRGNALDAF